MKTKKIMGSVTVLLGSGGSGKTTRCQLYREFYDLPYNAISWGRKEDRGLFLYGKGLFRFIPFLSGNHLFILHSKLRRIFRTIMAILFVLSFPLIPLFAYLSKPKELVGAVVFFLVMFGYQIWETFYDGYTHRILMREMEERHNKNMRRL